MNISSYYFSLKNKSKDPKMLNYAANVTWRCGEGGYEKVREEVGYRDTLAS